MIIFIWATQNPALRKAVIKDLRQKLRIGIVIIKYSPETFQNWQNLIISTSMMNIRTE